MNSSSSSSFPISSQNPNTNLGYYAMVRRSVADNSTMGSITKRVHQLVSEPINFSAAPPYLRGGDASPEDDEEVNPYELKSHTFYYSSGERKVHSSSHRGYHHRADEDEERGKHTLLSPFPQAKGNMGAMETQPSGNGTVFGGQLGHNNSVEEVYSATRSKFPASYTSLYHQAVEEERQQQVQIALDQLKVVSLHKNAPPQVGTAPIHHSPAHQSHQEWVTEEGTDFVAAAHAEEEEVLTPLHHLHMPSKMPHQVDYHQNNISIKEVEELMWEIYFLEDKGKFDEYLQKFVNLAFPVEKLLENCSEEFILNLLLEYFVGGLREDFKLYVSSSKPVSLFEAMNLAIYYEDRVKCKGAEEGDGTTTAEVEVAQLKPRVSLNMKSLDSDTCPQLNQQLYQTTKNPFNPHSYNQYPHHEPQIPTYGFQNLERQTIVLADGTAQTYLALPPDYPFQNQNTQNPNTQNPFQNQNQLLEQLRVSIDQQIAQFQTSWEKLKPRVSNNNMKNADSDTGARGGVAPSSIDAIRGEKEDGKSSHHQAIDEEKRRRQKKPRSKNHQSRTTSKQYWRQYIREILDDEDSFCEDEEWEHKNFSSHYSSRPASRNAFDGGNPKDSSETRLALHYEIAYAGGIRFDRNAQNVVVLQNKASQTFASVLIYSLSRNTTHDTQQVLRAPSPSLPNAGVQLSVDANKIDSSAHSSNVAKSDVVEFEDLLVASSGLNMSYPRSPLARLIHASQVGPDGPVRLAERNLRFHPGLNNFEGGIMGLCNQGPNGNLDEGFPSTLLEEFKSNNTRCFELSQIAGHVVEFIADQFGSRSIQSPRVLHQISDGHSCNIFSKVVDQYSFNKWMHSFIINSTPRPPPKPPPLSPINNSVNLLPNQRPTPKPPWQLNPSSACISDILKSTNNIKQANLRKMERICSNSTSNMSRALPIQYMQKQTFHQETSLLKEYDAYLEKEEGEEKHAAAGRGGDEDCLAAAATVVASPPLKIDLQPCQFRLELRKRAHASTEGDLSELLPRRTQPPCLIRGREEQNIKQLVDTAENRGEYFQVQNPKHHQPNPTQGEKTAEGRLVASLFSEEGCREGRCFNRPGNGDGMRNPISPCQLLMLDLETRSFPRVEY